MPIAEDYNQARALPPKPAAPDRPAAGVIRHGCHQPAPQTDQPAAGPIHPWDNGWAPPDPQHRLRPSKEMQASRAELHRQAKQARQAAQQQPAPPPEPEPALSLKPDTGSEPEPQPVRKFRFHIDFANGPNVVPEHHQNGRCPCRPWVLVKPGHEFCVAIWIHHKEICRCQ